MPRIAIERMRCDICLQLIGRQERIRVDWAWLIREEDDRTVPVHRRCCERNNDAADMIDRAFAEE